MTKDEELKQWEEQMREAMATDMLPKMQASRFVIGMVQKENIDPILLMQIGAALLLNKPLILLCDPDVELSKKMVQVADAIVVSEGGWRSEATKAKICKAIEVVYDQRRRAEQPI